MDRTLNFSCICEKECEVPIFDAKVKNGNDYVSYGVDNKLPAYLWKLYVESSLLGGIINTTTDYVCGNDVIGGDAVCNYRGETYSELLRKMVIDLNVYGGYAVHILRNHIGEISELYHIPFEYIRLDENATKVYYSKDWSAYRKKVIELDIYDSKKQQPSSVFYYGNNSRSVYPIPSYFSALKEIETGIRIGNFHLNAIKNNFTPSVIINFNSGDPTDEDKHYIENALNDKFAGDNNALKALISFNNNKDSAVTVERLSDDQYDKKYDSLRSHIVDTICMATRCPSMLLGAIPKGTGFNAVEYQELFKLYNTTVILALQRKIMLFFDKVIPGKIHIEPFQIKFDENDISNQRGESEVV